MLESEGRVCPSSPAYLEIIDKAIREAYDPSSLGDPELIRHKFDCQIKSNEDAVKYADEALKVLDDPYSAVYSKAELAKIKESQEGKFYGLGIRFETEKQDPANGRFPIKDLQKGSAAELAELKAGDVLTHINGKELKGKTLDDISSLIRTDSQRPVDLSIERNGQVIELKNIMRKLVDTPAVKGPVLKDGIAHIHMSTFSQSDSAQELKDALEKHPQAKAYIIDLRQNGGGLVVESYKALSLFMEKGTLSTEKQRVADAAELSYYKTSTTLTPDKIIAQTVYEDMPSLTVSRGEMERFPDLVDKPVVVLVDERTASAAEIFAAGLQENGEATVIGKRTLGKGIGQTWYSNMPEGSTLAITNLRLFTPKGSWLGDGFKNRIGIKPDIEVPEGEDALLASFNYLKKMLDKNAIV